MGVTDLGPREEDGEEIHRRQNDSNSNTEHETRADVLDTGESTPLFPNSPEKADVKDDDGDYHHAKPTIPPSPDAYVNVRRSPPSTNLLSDGFTPVDIQQNPPYGTPQITSEGTDVPIIVKEDDDAPGLASVKSHKGQSPFQVQVKGQAHVEDQAQVEAQARQVQGTQGKGEVEDRKFNISHSVRSSIPDFTKTVRLVVENISSGRTRKSPMSTSSPPMYGYKKSGGYLQVSRRWEWSVRCGAMLLSLVAFLLMLVTSQERQGAGSMFNMKFNDFDAYNYMVAVNVIIFTYFSCQVLVLAHLAIKGDSTLPRSKRFIMYVLDQVLAFLSFSASSAAATAAHLCRRGLPNIWPPACSTWKLWVFCTKADVAAAMSFLASLCVIGSALFSGHHLSK